MMEPRPSAPEALPSSPSFASRICCVRTSVFCDYPSALVVMGTMQAHQKNAAAEKTEPKRLRASPCRRLDDVGRRLSRCGDVTGPFPVETTTVWFGSILEELDFMWGFLF